MIAICNFASLEFMRIFMKKGWPVLFVLLMFGKGAFAKVDVQSFDSSIVIDEVYVEYYASKAVDSMVSNHPFLANQQHVLREFRHIYFDDTFDFYLVLLLLLCFGAMRFINPRYFQYLLRAFRSPSLSVQQLKDQLEKAVLPNLAMNLLFAASAGIYIYFAIKVFSPQRYAQYPPSLLIGIIIGSLVLLYSAKYVVMMFSGWVFNLKSAIGHYMYNVMLINKVMSVALLPFIILLAFADSAIAVPATVVSLALVLALLVNRYMRSWQVLGQFFQYSKFHFFAYLCASEILPMALLTKLLIRGMYY